MDCYGNRMKQNKLFTILHSPVFQVIATWIWVLVGGAITALIILLVNGVDLSSAPKILGEKQYLATYIEIVSVGLLPVMFSLICKDDPAQYGFSRKGLVKSLILSGLFVIAALFGYAFLTNGQLMSGLSPGYHLDFPWNLWYAVLGIFAYGPLEVFFFMWLVTNTDRIFKSENRTLSRGLLVTVVIFGITHILITNIYNAFYTSAIFFILGLIYKYTRNSIGPMIAWTLINGQVWWVAQMLWS